MRILYICKQIPLKMEIIKKYLCLAISISIFSGSMQLVAQDQLSVNLEDYNSLWVSGRIDLELIPSDSKEMTVISKNGNAEEVNIEFKDKELKISVRPKINRNDDISIRLPYRKIERIEAAAGAVINSARDLEADDIFLHVLSGGKIELSLRVKNIDAKITQVSDIILYGSAESQNVTVNAGGNYLAYDLQCQDTFIKVSSGSQGKVTASRKLDATANINGFIGYIGDPAITNVKTSLGGEITSFTKNPE